MIEYLGPDREEKERRARAYAFLKLVLVIIIFIFWTILMTVLFYPRLQSAYKDSGLEPLFEKSASSSYSSSTSVTIFIATENGLEERTIETRRRGGDIYHDTIEALLSDKVDGKLDLIHPSVKLIGLSTERGICYVDFSRKFLDSKTQNGITASLLVERTLCAFPAIEKVVILVEGKRIS